MLDRGLEDIEAGRTLHVFALLHFCYASGDKIYVLFWAKRRQPEVVETAKKGLDSMRNRTTLLRAEAITVPFLRPATARCIQVNTT